MMKLIIALIVVALELLFVTIAPLASYSFYQNGAWMYAAVMLAFFVYRVLTMVGSFNAAIIRALEKRN